MPNKEDFQKLVLSEMTIKELLEAYRHTDDVVLMNNISKEIQSRCSIDPKLV